MTGGSEESRGKEVNEGKRMEGRRCRGSPAGLEPVQHLFCCIAEPHWAKTGRTGLAGASASNSSEVTATMSLCPLTHEETTDRTNHIHTWHSAQHPEELLPYQTVPQVTIYVQRQDSEPTPQVVCDICSVAECGGAKVVYTLSQHLPFY